MAELNYWFFALFLHEVMAYGEWALLMILFSALG
jgi:hypothetical protein